MLTRRQSYLNEVADKSISIIFSGFAKHRSADAHFPFVVNKNFYYLTGIEQPNTTLVMIKGAGKNESFLFIDKIDPVKALWEGETLSFDKAAEIAQLDNDHIRDNASFDSFIAGLLSATRKAFFGEIESIYLDLEYISSDERTKAQAFAAEIQTSFPYIQIRSSQKIISVLRMVKDHVEIEKTVHAIDITNQGLKRILAHLKAGLHEYELEAEFKYVLHKHHTDTSFDTIAASGANATVLHYVDNDSKIEDGQLILLDLGALSGQYAADISRTYPVSGVFSKRQKEIYAIVLEANKKTIEWVKAGITFQEFNDFGKKILTEGLKRIGLIKEDHEITKYYYHSLGHYLGLDVHDVGDYSRVIPEGAIVTVEPGLYIAEEGIGIRIEDDILITKEGCVLLSKDIIKEIDDIESYMKNER